LLIACAARVWGQAASIPAEARTAADLAPFETQIQAYIQANVEKLSSVDDAVTRSAGREALAKAVDDPNSSPAYFDTYARLLNASLVNLAKSESLPVRLNAAITAARVAEKANNSRLADSASAFVKDSSTPVVLWGVRTAKFVMPSLMSVPAGAQTSPLPSELVPAVKEHPIGPIVQDTYDALTLGMLSTQNRSVPQGLSNVIPYVLELVNFRIDLYTQAIPYQPWAEQKAGLFFQNRAVWQVLTPVQQVEAMQALSNLISVVAQQTQNASPEDRDKLTKLVSQIAGSISVIAGDYLQQQQLRQAAILATRIDSRTPPPEIKARVAQILPQIIQIPTFSQVKPPPVIGAPPLAPAAAADESPVEEAVEEGPDAVPAADEETAQ
jgi:hypothetical protein